MSERAARLLHRLTGPSRAQLARALARELGAEDLVVLVRDPEVDAMVPPPGFPATLHGGASWRSLVRRCLTPGRHAEEVELPRGMWRRAEVLVAHNLALVFLGGQPSREALAALAEPLPLLAFAFAAEQKAHVAAAAADEARKAAGRAHVLAEALEAARADASRLNAKLRMEHRLKDQFLATLAHELRNPLSPIVHTLDLLRATEPADSAVRTRIDLMSRHARQLAELVNDLLDIARVSQGRIELKRERLPLEEVVRVAVETTQHMFEARRHALELALCSEALYVDGDRTRLTQVLANLLHNAAKYTPAGGRVTVAVARANALAHVSVTDTGIGIASEALPHVFDLFHQGTQSLARADGGLGIGLTLARSLVELHGGRVHAQSEGPGRGSRFTVALPLAQDRECGGRPALEERGSDAPRALLALVVDDNEDAGAALGALLRALGHEAAVSHSAAGALELAANFAVEVAFLDIGLPDIDGYELARRLRRAQPRSYLVALTGYGGPEHVARARAAGFDEHVVKPASMETIAGITRRAAAATGAPTSASSPTSEPQ